MIKNQAIQTALLGDWDTAITLNKQILKKDPKDVEALNRIALAQTILGNLDEARKTYKKVLTIDPLNTIALKNLKRLKTDTQLKNETTPHQLNNTFLEETGKTKVIDLLNLAQPEIISSLRTGQSVGLIIKRSKVFIVGTHNRYIGVIPDDIGNRLIRFMKAGAKYDAFIKSANSHLTTVFVREIKRSSRFKDQPSFTHSQDQLLVPKAHKAKTTKHAYDEEDSSDSE